MQHASHVAPVKIKLWDDRLQSAVLKTIGYRARCRCGHRSRLYRRRADALDVAREHVSDRVTA